MDVANFGVLCLVRTFTHGVVLVLVSGIFCCVLPSHTQCRGFSFLPGVFTSFFYCVMTHSVALIQRFCYCCCIVVTAAVLAVFLIWCSAQMSLGLVQVIIWCCDLFLLFLFVCFRSHYNSFLIYCYILFVCVFSFLLCCFGRIFITAVLILGDLGMQWTVVMC